MRKQIDSHRNRRLSLSTQTVRALDQVELASAGGGYGKSAYVCTGKLSGCSQCPE